VFAPESFQQAQGLAESGTPDSESNAAWRLGGKRKCLIPGRVRRRERLKSQHGPGRDPLLDALPGEKESFGRGIWLCRIPVDMAEISVVDLLPGRLTGLLQRLRLIEREERSGGEIVEQCVHGIVQVRTSPLSIRFDWHDCFRGLWRSNELPRRQHPALLQFCDGGLG
jgi:hypothetical protein